MRSRKFKCIYRNKINGLHRELRYRKGKVPYYYLGLDIAHAIDDPLFTQLYVNTDGIILTQLEQEI